MNHFINVLKKYATFSGRATRSEYWYFVLIYSIIYTILMGIDFAIGTFSKQLMGNGSFLGFLSTAYSLVLFLPSLAVTVRRLHDINKSGWWILLIFVPIIGFILLVVYLCTNSKEDNKYGINPKNLANENQKDNSSSESSNNVITQLEKLSKLKEDGVLTVLVDSSGVVDYSVALSPRDRRSVTDFTGRIKFGKDIEDSVEIKRLFKLLESHDEYYKY